MCDSNKIDSRGTATDQTSGLCSPFRGKQRLVASTVGDSPESTLSWLNISIFWSQCPVWRRSEVQTFILIPDSGKMVRWSVTWAQRDLERRKAKIKCQLPALKFNRRKRCFLGLPKSVNILCYVLKQCLDTRSDYFALIFSENKFECLLKCTFFGGQTQGHISPKIFQTRKSKNIPMVLLIVSIVTLLSLIQYFIP